MGSRPNNLYLCSPAAPPAARPKGEGRGDQRPMHLDNFGAKHDTVNDKQEIGAAGDFVVWRLLSRSPLATTPRKEARFSMSEYTQVGVRTQAQPCTHLNQPWPSVWGEIPIIEPNEGCGRVIQTPLRPINFFLTVPHGGSVLRLYCAL